MRLTIEGRAAKTIFTNMGLWVLKDANRPALTYARVVRIANPHRNQPAIEIAATDSYGLCRMRFYDGITASEFPDGYPLSVPVAEWGADILRALGRTGDSVSIEFKPDDAGTGGRMTIWANGRGFDKEIPVMYYPEYAQLINDRPIGLGPEESVALNAQLLHRMASMLSPTDGKRYDGQGNVLQFRVDGPLRPIRVDDHRNGSTFDLSVILMPVRIPTVG